MDEIAHLEQQMSTPSAEPQIIVGIGASAGGLEAIEEFFEAVSTDRDFSYVVIQHLSPDVESLMDKLLARKTELPIKVVEDGMRLERRTVYLMPPKKDVVLADGFFDSVDRVRGTNYAFPIDKFFCSLAAHAGRRGVAVVLSGAGSDGSRGVRDVTKAGGHVLSQSTETAKFESMPRSACDSGAVDRVAAPAEMPALIEAYYEHSIKPAEEIGAQRDDSDGHDSVRSILDLLRRRFSIDFTHYNMPAVERRIRSQILENGAEGVDDFFRRLLSEDSELDAFYRDLLIGPSTCFHDGEVFKQLKDDVVKPLLERLGPGEEFRVWVVGTATGEEAYMLSMLLVELADELEIDPLLKIFASDIHPNSVEMGSRGVFATDSLKRLSAKRRRRFFRKKSNVFHVAPELRSKIVFVHHDVTNNAPFMKLDFVACRNLFTYLNSQAKDRVQSLFHFGLKQDGVLWLGGNEPHTVRAELFDTIDEHVGVYRKRPDADISSKTRMPFSSQLSVIVPSEPVLSEAYTGSIDRHLIELSGKLLEHFYEAGVLLDSNHQLLHTFGGATKFLRIPSGRPSNDILDLVLPAIRAPVNALIRRAKLGQSASLIVDVPIDDTPSEPVEIVVQKVARSEGEMLLSFNSKIDSPTEGTPVLQLDATADEECELLESELARMKERLQTTIEETHTTNEELQSTNEQLTASNEELQSTNEELHSVNEELYTVNAEHQRKIEELVELNDDMDNLLNSTTVHTIFLDRNLNLRRFTPGIHEIFNLIRQDIGRSLESFTHNIRLDEDLIAKVQSVIKSRGKYEREVQDKQLNWYLLRILPYMTGDEVDGAVVTLVDISTLKQTESKLAELSEIVEHSGDAIFRQDIHGIIRTWNRGAEELFRRQQSDVLERSVSILQLTCQDIDILQMLKLVESGQSLEHVEASYLRGDGERLDVALSLSPIRGVSGKVVGASTIARDITKFKQAESKVRESIRRRDEFLAMLSHELRNPFAAVLNATKLLSEVSADDSTMTAEANEVITNNVQHMARILDDLLDISRITNDKLAIGSETVDLLQLVDEVVNSVKHHIDAKQQEMRVSVPDHPLYVDGDTARLLQMQVNLLVNASKYTDRGGRIEYRLEMDKDDAIIRVIDNGNGITPQLIDTIFEPFVQARQTLDRAQGGMGLGLALVHRVVTAHGGVVSAESDGLGKGSEFKVRLATTKNRPQPRDQSELARAVMKKMLIIEDNDGIRLMLSRTLKLKGIDVVDAASGSEGLSLLEKFSPDVVIVDIGLPDTDGYAVARQIRKLPGFENILLVAVTGYGRDRDREIASAAGFDIHLLKPIAPNDLLKAIIDNDASMRTK